MMESLFLNYNGEYYIYRNHNLNTRICSYPIDRNYIESGHKYPIYIIFNN